MTGSVELGNTGAVSIEPVVVSTVGEFTTLVENPDGSFSRKLTDGTINSYDTEGILTDITDPNGNTTQFNYDIEGRILEIVDPVGLVTQFRYLTSGILRCGTVISEIEDPAGRITGFDHDSDCNLITIINPDGTRRSFEYDENHLVTSQNNARGVDSSDPASFATGYEYDNSGRVQKSTLPLGAERLINANQTIGLVHNPDCDSDPNASGCESNPFLPIAQPSISNPQDEFTTVFQDSPNRTTLFSQLDPSGKPGQIIDPNGRRTLVERDANGMPLKITRANGSIIANRFDERGNLTQTTLEDIGAITTYTYEPNFNQITSITDPEGNSTRLNYDAKGNLIEVIDALGNASTLTYNSRGLLRTYTDRRGNTTIYSYDVAGNLVSVTDALNNVITYEYDQVGNITKITDQEVRITRFSYDELNRLSREIDAIGATTQYAYDKSSNLIRIISPNAEVTNFTYDERDRLIQINNPVTGRTQLSYDIDDNLASITDEEGSVLNLEYDNVSQITGIIDGGTNNTVFDYDSLGNLSSLSDENNNTTRLFYDTLGRQIERMDSLGISEFIGYDSRSNITSYTNRRGQSISYAHDPLSRLAGVNAPGNAKTYAYDEENNLVAASDDDGSVSFTYDKLNRVISTATNNSGNQSLVSIDYEYDGVGNRTLIADSLGGSAQYVYDNRNLLSELTDNTNNTLIFSYDLSRRINNITYPNGVIGEFSHDSRGRLSDIAYRNNTTSILSQNYIYNNVGNVTSISETSSTRSFSYDADHQITSGGTTLNPESYAYDEVGNRTTSHLSQDHNHNSANRLIQDDTFDYTYDADGNQNTRTHRASGEITTFVWNAEGELIEIQKPDNSVINYRYDATGRRIEKAIDGVPIQYVYDGQDILLELDASNALLAGYIHGDLIDLPLVLQRDDQHYYYHSDRLGSIRAITDNSGNIENLYDYDSYGNPVISQESVLNPFEFTGREYDNESGLYFYRSRLYDARAGRYISEDPIDFNAGDSNLYRYTSNNPQNITDPTGLAANFVAQCVAGAAIGVAEEVVIELISNCQAPTLKNVARAAVTGCVVGIAVPQIAAKFRKVPVSNPVPRTVARVVPETPITRASGTLGRPGASDVFVTGASDIRGLNAKQIAERLTIPESPTGFRVIEFPTPRSGIASPVNRTNPGFIGGGRTVGGAREFVIPNGLIPTNSSTRVVR